MNLEARGVPKLRVALVAEVLNVFIRGSYALLGHGSLQLSDDIIVPVTQQFDPERRGYFTVLHDFVTSLTEYTSILYCDRRR
jgi:hypothetical protein